MNHRLSLRMAGVDNDECVATGLGANNSAAHGHGLRSSSAFIKKGCIGHLNKRDEFASTKRWKSKNFLGSNLHAGEFDDHGLVVEKHL